ncbi:type II toxin-antitoxin system death-on-curing family toxin [Pseudoclavibacter chungangensis]|uniref:Type II toxin-antitoxin system death-on-curing family toxin n=1 Tax=Pseudoclavibacter chungangensis TaxID=587635 RepID=A0A7J5C4B6_9MICO|nr:type II toxin-antitoxin system death-on-curing family toxin [Pseudoclavibacter chungangensis]KAB1662619.1 type II toxin-antitoxin system death-on-curing family toxin [Pseudoclavibacter chungangensis]NYJ68672.1 death-on-curing protein [Pseudoclavibacter chungangensis]
MTEFLTVEQVIALHDREKVCALLNRGYLESAVGQPAATWGGTYLYPTLLQQAGVLLFGICKAHAFEDANKRTAWLACVAFLDLNGVELVDVPQAEVEQLMVDVADNGYDADQVTAWLIDRV